MSDRTTAPAACSHLRTDWTEARRLYEVEGLGVVEIARRFGTRHQTVTAHRDGEGWVHRTEIAHEAHRSAVRAFVERQTEAVVENLTAKAELTRKVLAQTRVYVEKLATDAGLSPGKGLRAMRDAAAVVKTLEAVDVSLLRDAPWRASDPASEEQDLLPLPPNFDFCAVLGPTRPTDISFEEALLRELERCGREPNVKRRGGLVRTERELT